MKGGKHICEWEYETICASGNYLNTNNECEINGNLGVNMIIP
jgi:hypothetical protein